MRPVLEVIPHPTGPWLVKIGPVRYAVPRRFGRALRPLAGGVPGQAEILTRLTEAGIRIEGVPAALELENWTRDLARALNPKKDDDDDPRTCGRTSRSIHWRVPLIPESFVRRLAEKLKPWAGTRALTALVLIGGAGYLAAAAGPGRVGFSLDLGNTIAGLGLFFLTAVWHELGHAAALARAGYPPGGIGAGVLFVIPVLFADVTAVGALPRSGRLRVDVAGMIFQLAAGGCLVAVGARGIFSPALFLAGGSALFAIAWSLFPFIRSDGYWLLCDLLGLEDLDRPPPVPVRTALRIFLPLYQLANAAFLLGVGLYFPWRLAGLVFGLVRRLNLAVEPSTARWLSILTGLVIMGAMGIGIVRRIRILIRSAWVVAKGPGNFIL